MPVTRSSSRQASQQPSASGQPYASRRTNASGSNNKRVSRPPSNEIIVLSSDDDEPPPKGILPAKKSPARAIRKKAVPPAHSGDVLEISSDDEPRPRKTSMRKQGSSSETKNKDLERTIEELQDELKRSEQQLASTSRELEELKRECSNKDVLAGLEELTLCEVCTVTMWCPYTLPECGHSFCEGCLIDWFSTNQAQHMTANPQLDDSRAALAEQLRAFIQMVPNLHAYGPHGRQHARAVLDEVRRHRPEYTCPSCRRQVLNKPTEDFRLKNLISQIAELMGETNPHKIPSICQGSSPFDHFFAAPIITR